MKDSCYGLVSRLGVAKERISELGNMSIEHPPMKCKGKEV